MSSAVTGQALARAISVRVAQRRENFEKKAKKAETFKNEGNGYFKDGDYQSAAESYGEAIQVNPSEPNYYSNMAAALIKLEEYYLAQEFTVTALFIDPCHMKARYRRLQARKAMEQYDSALCDANAMLRIDPSCPEAQVEIKELKRLRQLRGPLWEESDDEDDSPNEMECDKLIIYDPGDWTDSEDSEHTGNNVPCKYYNHGGCARGLACPFSHAPDDLSERDRLGKNVCVFYLLRICKFGGAKCNYSHFRNALPERGWWNDREKTAAKALEIKTLGKSGVLKARFVKPGGLDSRTLSSKAKATLGNRQGKGKGEKTKSEGSKRNYLSKPRYDSETEEEMGEHMANFGFTLDEVNELMCQGVKPWDDDAAASPETYCSRQNVCTVTCHGSLRAVPIR